MKTYNFIEAVNSGRAMKTEMIDLVGYRLNSTFRSLDEMMRELHHQNPHDVKHISAIFTLPISLVLSIFN